MKMSCRVFDKVELPGDKDNFFLVDMGFDNDVCATISLEDGREKQIKKDELVKFCRTILACLDK